MLKLAFIDAGELGWSLYLSAYIRWAKKETDRMIAVITYPDRKCLYENLADDIIFIPELFHKKYDLNKQDSYKVRKVGWDEINAFFLPYAPKGYRFAEYSEYPSKIISDSRSFVPYKYSRPPENGKEIMVFPRCRTHPLWARRNLTENFYLQLIKQLCYEFPKLTVRTIGTNNGAYDIKTDKFNYINWVGRGGDLQDMINRCQSAVAAVGSQSALPKISLLQGVPTFMIGHQKERHTQKENWKNTKMDFYDVDGKAYAKININDCIKAAIAFVRGVQ